MADALKAEGNKAFAEKRFEEAAYVLSAQMVYYVLAKNTAILLTLLDQ
jgi:hypothetical protein